MYNPAKTRLIILALILSVFGGIYNCYLSPDLNGGYYYPWVCFAQIAAYVLTFIPMINISL